MFIALGILAVAVFYVIGVYNGLQRLKTQITASIQEIGNQLKRQASLIPNLEAAVKGYMKHEKGIFTMLTEARKTIATAESTGKLGDIEKAIDQLNTIIPKMQLTVEDNPELKADQTVTKFMDELTDTADKMSYARRSVIDLTQAYNQKLVMFPSNIIANLFGFQTEKGFETPTSGSHLQVSAEEMTDPKIKLE